MNHSFEDGGVRDMVLKACMSWAWSKDGGGAVGLYVDAGGGADGVAPGVHGMAAPGGHGIGDVEP